MLRALPQGEEMTRRETRGRSKSRDRSKNNCQAQGPLSRPG